MNPKYNPGQKLWIKNEAVTNSALGWIDEMCEYLGEYVTISGVFDLWKDAYGYFIVEDSGNHLWDEEIFCEENPNNTLREEEVSFEDFLGGFKVM